MLSIASTLDLAALTAFGGVSGPRVAVAGTGVLALPGLIPEKGLSAIQGVQSKTKSAGLAGLDSEAVRRWVAEAARTVRQIPPPVIVPSSSQQHLPQHHHHSAAHRHHQESSPPTVGTSPFVLPASMTQTPSMHLLENNNLLEAMAQQQQQSPQQQLHQQSQKQKQNSPTNNNNTIEGWRSIQGGHQWWSPPHQEQVVASVHAGSQSQLQIAALGQRQQQQQQTTSEIDQPLDFSVGSLQQQRLQSRNRTVHERLQGRMQDNNNGTGSGPKIAKGNSRRSYSPSDGSSSGSEDEGVLSTGGSPAGPLRGVENGEWIYYMEFDMICEQN